MSAGEARARAAAERLDAWLFREALPTWWAFGIDHADGSFRERLGTRCEALDEPRRTRVLARQVYVFATAARMGWPGPAMRAAARGYANFLAHAVKPDGTVRIAVRPDGTPADDGFILYDQAFALFASAAVTAVAGRERPEAMAVLLRTTLLDRYRHPLAGFEEAAPPTAPLKANPHMHLLEAFLAWEEAGGDATWSRLADEIADLALARFVDPASGFLREFYAPDWSPAPGEAGRIVEPGHLFEWAWLLVRWGRSRRRPDALAAAVRLAGLGELHGVDPARGVAVNEILDDGAPRDGAARLWPQTERIKAHVALSWLASDAAERDRRMGMAAEAAAGLERYLRTETPGLWRDRMAEDGSLAVEPAPASTLYHIVCAIDELRRAVRAP